ncbi:MAG TPA: hypothetical protein VI033_03520 [Candidatus Nitrosopolaris sp.]
MKKTQGLVLAHVYADFISKGVAPYQSVRAKDNSSYFFNLLKKNTRIALTP